jgi:hypothetical protein
LKSVVPSYGERAPLQFPPPWLLQSSEVYVGGLLGLLSHTCWQTAWQVGVPHVDWPIPMSSPFGPGVTTSAHTPNGLSLDAGQAAQPAQNGSGSCFLSLMHCIGVCGWLGLVRWVMLHPFHCSLWQVQKADSHGSLEEQSGRMVGSSRQTGSARYHHIMLEYAFFGWHWQCLENPEYSCRKSVQDIRIGKSCTDSAHICTEPMQASC